MNLFPEQSRPQPSAHAPLAERMRPRTLDDFIGQEHLLGPKAALRMQIETDQIRSFILWGPPGSGKTALAHVIAHATHSFFAPFSAITSGVKDIRKAVEEAATRRRLERIGTLLFVDEIHRFNRAQQDAFLPHVENGTIVLIGATTENPSFEVNSPLLSRLQVYVLNPLSPEQVGTILDRALGDPERGLADKSITLADDARQLILLQASGDARSALNTLELSAQCAQAEQPEQPQITTELVRRASATRVLRYDKHYEEHFNLISALHKSLRASDADASLYWLARMLEAGEDPLYVVRRLVRFASEDVGLADPNALGITLAAKEAVHFIGMPEGALALAQAVTYLACAPKSNALYKAYAHAADDATHREQHPVPMHLRNAPTDLMKQVGYGNGYQYDHDHDEHHSGQPCLPEPLLGTVYYTPGTLGFEKEIQKRLAYFRKRRAEAAGEDR